MSAPNAVQPLGGDLPTANRFLFEVDGVEIGVFRRVSGLELRVGLHELREGGQNGFVHKLPGRMQWPHVILRAGLTQSDNLFAWIAKSSGEGFANAENKLARCTGAVTALNTHGDRLRSWEMQDVFPVRWRGPDFETGSSDNLEEELEIAHHGFASATQRAAT